MKSLNPTATTDDHRSLVISMERRRHPILHYLLLSVGWLSVVLGVIGIFLPLLPTTPFLLLAAACFARTSDRFYQWLVSHPHLGKYVTAYLDGKGIPFKAKCYTITLIWSMMTLSAWLVAPPIWAIICMYIIALSVSVYLLRMPTLEVKGKQ